MSARVDEFSVGLHPPVVTARGALFDRRGLVLVVTDDAGHWGRGEVAPLPGWSAVTLDEARRELAVWVDATNAGRKPALPTAVSAEVGAGIDTALWALRAAQAGVPLWRLLPGTGEHGSVAVNALAVGSTPAEVAGAVAEAAGRGFRAVKLKLGMADDHARLDAVAEVLPDDVSVRLDANGAWTVDEARTAAARAHGVLGSRLEYVEDPVGSLRELESRPAGPVPVAVDELVRSRDDLRRVIDGRLAQVVVVKPPLLGGITPVLELAEVAGAGGVDVVISSLYDGPVGLAAWCHLAASLGGSRAHGLGTAALMDGAADHLVPRRGLITL